MKKHGYRELIYGNYKEDLLSNMVTGNIEKEKRYLLKYVKRNYEKYLPKDKKCKILDVGCGLGYYIWCLKKLGYCNTGGWMFRPRI